jgi:uncharacterized protein
MDASDGPKKLPRLLLAALGLVATGLGVVGLWVPGLPTTPFILVALWAFSRSSPRLHGWLSRMPLLAAALAEARRFEEQRAIRRSVKLTALSTAWGSVALLALATGGSRPVLIGAVLVAAAAATLFLWLVPTAERLNDRSGISP